MRLPDISGEIYEKDEHYWQDVTVRYDVTITYEDKKVRPKDYNRPLIRQWKEHPPPYHEQYKMWAEKWKQLVSRKEWQEKELEQTTTSYDLGPVVPPTNAPIISKNNYQFWYGCVNCWSQKVNGKYIFIDQIPKLVEVGCTGYHIEMFGWKGGETSMANVADAYQKLVTLCRENKMWLFVDVINGNWNGAQTNWTLGMGPHDHLTMEYIVSNYGQQLINIIKDNGPQNVIIQPIGEPGSKGQLNPIHRFQDWCCDQLGEDFVLVTEPGRNNSSKMSRNTQYSTVHVTNDVPTPLNESQDLVKGKNDGAGDWGSSSGCDIVVSDSGPAIQALASPETGSQQGWLHRWTSACSRASRLVGYVRNYKGKAAVVVYYHFKFKCMGESGSTVDGELSKGSWNDIKSIVNPRYPT